MNPLEILGQVMQTLLKFCPRVWWAPTFIRGVLFVRGKRIKSFGPGMVVWFPLWTTMETCATVRQVMDIDHQTVTTKDGKSVIVAGVCSYLIDDHVKYLTENYQAEHSLDEAIAACLREVVVDKDVAGDPGQQPQHDRPRAHSRGRQAARGVRRDGGKGAADVPRAGEGDQRHRIEHGRNP